MDLRFEWDPEKAAANVDKHGISFEEAATVLVTHLVKSSMILAAISHRRNSRKRVFEVLADEFLRRMPS